MHFKAFQGIKKWKIKEKATEEDQSISAEEPVNEETMNEKIADLNQENELTKTIPDVVDDEDIFLKPHGPLGELEPEEDDEPYVKDNDNIAITETITKEKEVPDSIKVVEVKASELSAVKETESDVSQPLSDDPKPPSDDFSSLFNQEEEVENPLAGLIRSLPDVTAQELFHDLNEIKEIIKERQHAS